MIFILLRLVWFVGLLGLSIAATADLLFGSTSLANRINNLLPRIVVAVVWPLAIITPRGRYLLWARWQRERDDRDNGNA